MGDQVDFQETRRRFVPVVVGPHRNPLPHGPPAPRSAPAPCRRTNGFQQSIQRGRAGRQQPASHLRVQIQMAMALHGLHQVRQRSLEPLSADPVGSLPDHDHHLSHRFVVDAPASHRMRRAFIIVTSPQQPNGVLAVMAGYGHEFVEDTGLVIFRGRPVAVPYRSQQLLFCHLAHASCHTNASRFSVAFYLRQLLPISNLFIEAMRSW